MKRKLRMLIGLAIYFIQASHAQTLDAVNDKLSLIYSQEFQNIDTSYINYRKESLELIASNDVQKKINGYTTLALLEFYKRKYDNSIRNFKQAIKLDSLCYICYNRLHWTYWYGKDDYNNAFTLWKTAVRKFEELYSGDTSNLINTRKLYRIYSLREGKLPANIFKRKKYLAFLILQMDSTTAYNWWEYSFYQDNDPTGREYSLIKAFALEETETIYWNALANFYAEKKNINLLKEVLDKKGMNDAGNSAYIYQQKAYYLYDVGLKAEAAAIYQEAKSKGFTIVYKH